MYNSFSLLLALLVLFALGCDKNDDSDEGIGGDPNTLEITLSWEQLGADIDLDLTTYPEGAFNLAFISDDDVSGPGTETFRWTDNAPNGGYTVAVSHYDSDSPVTYTLTISSAASSRQFEGTVGENDVDFVSFVKAGTELQF